MRGEISENRQRMTVAKKTCVDVYSSVPNPLQSATDREPGSACCCASSSWGKAIHTRTRAAPAGTMTLTSDYVMSIQARPHQVCPARAAGSIRRASQPSRPKTRPACVLKNSRAKLAIMM